MARPKHDTPTPVELEVLHILWERSPLSVREVMEELEESSGLERAYTTVMSLLNVMSDKGFLKREPDGRAFRYRPRVRRGPTLRRIVGDVLDRAFEGSASGLVLQMLDHANLDSDELEEIRRLIDERRKEKRS